MRDELGNRMKEFYENRTRIKLPRRSYTIIRIDGRAFHSYTKGLIRPFDFGLIEDMNKTAIHLCKNIQGAKLGYVQSDEISIVLTDFDDIKTQAWFDNNIQKMVSIAASIATAKFNQLRLERMALLSNVSINPSNNGLNNVDIQNFKMAQFDARVFQIPFIDEVENYFIWRQKDAVRNSISSVAQSLYSSKELHGKNTTEMKDMIASAGVNWNDYDFRRRHGAVISRVDVEFTNGDEIYTRKRWDVINTPLFTQERDFIKDFLKLNNDLK